MATEAIAPYKIEELVKSPEVKDALKVLVDKNIIEFDTETNTLIINVDFRVKCKGMLNVDCDEHIIMTSGRDVDKTRDDNVPYAIWLNPDLDEEGKPIAK